MRQGVTRRTVWAVPLSVPDDDGDDWLEPPAFDVAVAVGASGDVGAKLGAGQGGHRIRPARHKHLTIA